MSSSTSSSPISPSSAWIQRPPTSSSSNRRGPTVEPLNLWPPTSTWAAYSSALASLSLGQLATGETSAPIKYPSRCSPLTPTTPTYSPSFSPQQTAVINSFGVHPLLQPDSPHSVTDGACPDFPTAFPLDFCTTNHHVAGHRSPTITTTTNSNNKRQLFQPEPPLPVSQKRSKSFTIDAILGLEELAASCCDVETAAKHLYHSSQDSYLRSESPNCQQQRRTSLSESPDSSPPPSSIALSAPSSSPRAKRVRTIFSAEQLERLEAEFARQQYMVGPERLVLAASLRLSESQVKVWFQNRRIKWRKQHLESQQMRLVTWRQHEDQQQSSQDHLHHHNLMANGPCMDDDQHSESFSD